MGCGSSLELEQAQRPVQEKAQPVVLGKEHAQKLASETLDSAKTAAVPALLAVLERRPKILQQLKVVSATADDARVREVAGQIMAAFGRAAENYERLFSCASNLEELGVKFIRLGVGNRFFREFGEFLVDELEAQSPAGEGVAAPAAVAWTPEHSHAWRQVIRDTLPYVADGVKSGRPTATSGSIQKSAEIVKAAWQEYVADDVADCGVKSYLSMFKNDPETLTVFFFKDSTNLAKDGRMREHVTRSFTVTGHMINLATKPVEFREKMERLGAAHGMKGVTREFVDALGRGILAMLADKMEDDFTPLVEAAFKRVLRDVSEMFDSGLKLWKSGAAPSASITGCAPPEFRRDYYASVGATKPKPLQ